MENIISTLQKITKLIEGRETLSLIERDLLLQHTRQLYEYTSAINVATTQEPTTSPILAMAEQAVSEIEMKDAESEQTKEEIFEEELTMEEEILLDDNEDEMVFDDNEERLLLLPTEADEKDTIELEKTMLEIHEADTKETELTLAAEAEKLPTIEHPKTEQTQVVSEKIESTNQDAFTLSLKEVLIPNIAFKVWQKDIRTFIGINDKYNFISELFKGNAEAYEEVLNEINNSENKEEAVLFLEHSGITTLYHWQAEGFSEQIFYNILNQFFASR